MAGGSVATGGVTSTGGLASTGGVAATGGVKATGGNISTGGVSSTGGVAATGGTAATGGVKATGGSAGGGTTSTGGITGTGGQSNPGTGGVSSTGGTSRPDAGADAASTGGVAATGGTSTATGGTTSTGGSTGAAAVHVFLLMGQSNMAGYPKATNEDKTKNERIRVLGFDDCAATGRKKDQWDVAVPPLHECWNGALGPGDYFSKTILAKLPANDTIALVPLAVSGEKIETFMKSGGSKYTWIIQRAQAGQKLGPIEGILFHQGESNSGDSTWPGKVNTLVTDMRTDLKLGDIPFLAGELAYDGPCAGHNTQVNKLPSTVKNAYVVSAKDLALDPADTQYRLHFSRVAQVEFGKRYAAKMIEALKW